MGSFRKKVEAAKTNYLIVMNPDKDGWGGKSYAKSKEELERKFKQIMEYNVKEIKYEILELTEELEDMSYDDQWKKAKRVKASIKVEVKVK